MAPYRARSKGRAHLLTKEEILQTAMWLVENEPVGAPSMRRLGGQLGVDPMAVYGHFPSKASLLDALSVHVFTTMLEGFDASASGVDRVRYLVRATRRVAISHPEVTRLVTARTIDLSPASTDSPWSEMFKLLCEALRPSGLAPQRVTAAAWAIASCVRGLIISEIAVLANRPEHREDPPGHGTPLHDLGPDGDNARALLYEETTDALIDALLHAAGPRNDSSEPDA